MRDLCQAQGKALCGAEVGSGAGMAWHAAQGWGFQPVEQWGTKNSVKEDSRQAEFTV